MRPLDQRKVLAARLWGATHFQYLASALFATRMVPVDRVGTVAVDEAWHLYMDPGLVEAWTAAQLGSVVVHHVGHLLRDHGARARSLGVGSLQAEEWVLAADAEINDDLGACLDLPIEPVTPQALGFEPFRFAEEYFHMLATRKPESTGGADGKRSCGSGCDRLPRDWKLRGGMSEAQRTLLRCQTAAEILSYSRGGLLPGTVPVGLQRWAEALLGARIDWRRVLEIRRALATVAGMVDYSYQKPSQRAAAVEDVILPGFVHE